MTEIYRKYGQEVGFKMSPSGFMIVLPNLNDNKDSKSVRSERADPHEEVDSLADQRAKSGLDYIQVNGPVSRMVLEAVWGISRSTATSLLDHLVKTGVLSRIGHGRNTKYTIAE